MKKRLIAGILVFTFILVGLASCKKQEGTSVEGSGEEVSSAAMPTHDEMKGWIKEAQETNPLVYAWIYIPTIELSHPVVHDPETKNNSYWENRNLAGQSTGSFEESVVYASYAVTPESSNTVIFGHNWDNILQPFMTEPAEGFTMFELLPAFAVLDFAKENQYIYLATETEIRSFHVFSVMYTEQNWMPEQDFNYVNPSLTPAQMEILVSEYKDRSIYDFDLDVTGGDNVLTLSTCTREVSNISGEQRYVVVARELRDGEDDKELVDVKENEDVKLPKI